jgi:hypothetical protein
VTTPAQDAPLVLPSVVFRPFRLLLICVALTALATVAAARLDQPAFGVFFGLGLALGLVNALLIRRSVSSITAEAHPLKAKMALNSATRLLIITVIGLVIAYVFRPLGLGALVGLATFEVLLVSSTALPVVKKLRMQASAPDGERTEGTADD